MVFRSGILVLYYGHSRGSGNLGSIWIPNRVGNGIGRVSKRGAAPLLFISPSPIKERGIQGVR